MTATGDVITLPARVGSGAHRPRRHQRIHRGGRVDRVHIGVGWSLRTDHTILRTVMRESLPILTVAGILDLIAGITIEKRLEDFVEFPVLLILLPGFLGTAGALGGVLSSRLATKVHLGLVRPGALPRGQAGSDIVMIFTLCVPIFAVAGVVADFGGLITGQVSPGLWQMIVGPGTRRVVGLAGCRDRCPTRPSWRSVRSRPGYLRHPDGDLVARFRRRVPLTSPSSLWALHDWTGDL